MNLIQNIATPVLQSLEKRIDEIIEKGYADLIKEVEESRKRILNITINNSERLGQTLIKEIKNFEKYINESASPNRMTPNRMTPKRKDTNGQNTIRKNSFTDFTDYLDDSVDIVVQPDISTLISNDRAASAPISTTQFYGQMPRETSSHTYRHEALTNVSSTNSASASQYVQVHNNLSNKISEDIPNYVQKFTNGENLQNWKGNLFDHTGKTKRNNPAYGNQNSASNEARLGAENEKLNHHQNGIDVPSKDFESHASQCINEDGTKVFKCFQCIYVTDDENHFQLHISDFHKLTQEPASVLNEDIISLKSHAPSKKTVHDLKANIMKYFDEKQDKRTAISLSNGIPSNGIDLAANYGGLTTPGKVKADLAKNIADRTPQNGAKRPLPNEYIVISQPKYAKPDAKDNQDSDKSSDRSVDFLQLQFLKGVLRYNLMKHPDAWPFNSPVDIVKLNIPEYPTIITTPMDFGTIKQRLNDNFYKKAQDCINDIDLVFSNCYKFNDPKMDIVAMAMSIQEVFKEQLLKRPGRY